jgi:hypothetical protein
VPAFDGAGIGLPRTLSETRMKARLFALIALAFAAPAIAAPTRSGAYHIFRPNLKIDAQDPAAKTMLYYAGPVLSNAKVAVVLWGKGVLKATVKGIGPFTSAIVNSTYVDQLAQYSTNMKGVNGMQGTNQTIGRGSYLGKFQITPKNKSKTVTDAQIQAEIEGQIASGALPKNDTNTLYMTYFPADITINLDGSLSCQAFGGYHEATINAIDPNNIFYAVMPDCGGGFPEQTVVASHEFGEAVTDAIPTPGSNPAFPQAWNTSNGYEIGDLCEGNDTTLTAAKKVYEIQELFDNSKNACATGSFHSP